MTFKEKHMFKLKPLKEVLAMTKDALTASLAPIRARRIKSQAETEMAKLDERLVTLEAKITEDCAKDDIDFNGIISKLDEYALTDRRIKQFKKILADLFPE